MKPNKIFLFLSDTNSLGMKLYAAISEDGVFLASHMCSDAWYARKDMQTNDKLLIYSNHYKDGYELVFVPEDEAYSHEALQKAIGIARGAA